MDTVEGIAVWWIPLYGRHVGLNGVARVIADLTGNGVLEQIGSGDSARYRLRKCERSTE
jgi:hypothetical protein